MNLRFTHETLTSFAVSAMLTSAFLASAPNGMIAAGAGPQPQSIMNALNGLHASGWTGTQDLMAPSDVAMPQSAAAVPAASAPAVTLTPERKVKLAKLMETYGVTMELNAAVTLALGLTHGNEVLTLRELGSRKTHFYTPLPDGGLLLIYLAPQAHDYRVDANLNLIGGVIKDIDVAPIIIPTEEAERNVQIELEYWAALADRH
jgi:hypothetical protein